MDNVLWVRIGMAGQSEYCLLGQNQHDARSVWTVLWVRIGMMAGQYGQCLVSQNQQDARSVWTASFGPESA